MLGIDSRLFHAVDGVKHLVERRSSEFVERDGDMRASPKDFRDPFRTKRARAVLDEYAQAVVPGAENRAWEVHGSTGLLQQEVGHLVHIGHIAFTERVGVDADAPRRSCLAAVQGTPTARPGVHLRTVSRYRGHVVRGGGAATSDCSEAAVTISANEAIVGCV